MDHYKDTHYRTEITGTAVPVKGNRLDILTLTVFRRPKVILDIIVKILFRFIINCSKSREADLALT